MWWNAVNGYYVLTSTFLSIILHDKCFQQKFGNHRCRIVVWLIRQSWLTLPWCTFSSKRAISFFIRVLLMIGLNPVKLYPQCVRTIATCIFFHTLKSRINHCHITSYMLSAIAGSSGDEKLTHRVPSQQFWSSGWLERLFLVERQEERQVAYQDIPISQAHQWAP